MQPTMVILLNCLLFALIDAFVYCYCGAMVTNSFSKYLDCLYENHWYNLPVPLQKQLIIVMANLQRPLYYQGFGMVTLNLATFVNVKLKTYSYQDF